MSVQTFPGRTGHQWLQGFYDFIQALKVIIFGGTTVPFFFVDAVDTANLAGTYANGTSGVGATLTKSSAGAFPTIDGVVPFVGMTILLIAQTTAYQSGPYKLTRLGSTTVAWQLTRLTGWDQSAEMIVGSVFFVRKGTAGTSKVYVYTGAATPTVGSTSLTFAGPSSLPIDSAQTVTGVKDFAAGTLKIDNDSTTNAHTAVSAATAARTVTLPDASLTVAQAGVASASTTPGAGGATAPTFTGTASAAAEVEAFAGTGFATAGQVVTTTDNQTMTLNQCAGMWLITATQAPCLILSNTAVTGAPAVLTVYGAAPTTDAGTYKILKAPTPVGTVASHTHTGAAHTHVQT